MTVTKKPGFQCRVSLADAEIGEEEVLAHYEHRPADLLPGAVPEMLRSRMLSLRAFRAAGMMVAADLVDGKAVESLLVSMLTNPAVDYVHAHFAKPGCFAARIDRA